MWLARRYDGSNHIDCYEIDERTVRFRGRNPAVVERRKPQAWQFGRSTERPKLCGTGAAAIADTRAQAIAEVFWA